MTTSPRIFQRTLSNGLPVLLHESHDAPVASFWVWYRVGSRNEHAGLTGVSHWVEHMQFKGTPTLGKGQIFAEISRNGGVNNAMTSNDWTAYFETLPSDRIALAIQIESDRMTNSLFDPDETEAERTVILSEQQGAENSPAYLLYKAVVAAAFPTHPYGTMVIGHEEDLKTITRANLYDHYRRAYVPANAFVVAAGDFEAEALFVEIERAFGQTPAGEPLPPVTVVEPPRSAERRVTLHRPAPTSYLRIAYRTPAGNHPDTPALLVADAILSGAKGMGLASGGPMGKSARLYRALVATGLARAASSDFGFFLDPYVLMIGVTALPGTNPARIESVIDAEIERLCDEPVTGIELARAIKQVRAQYIYSSEGVTNQAFWLGQMALLGDYHRAETIIDEIAAVTAADVQRVARAYLVPAHRTLGWLIPEPASGGGTSEREHSTVAAVRWWGLGGPERQVRAPFERQVLTNGMVLLGQAHPGDPALAIRMRIAAGSVHDPDDKPGLAALTTRVLPRGSTRRGDAEINELTDGLGASLGLDPSQLFVDLRVRALREDAPTMIALAAEILHTPAFPPAEIERARAELLAVIKEQEADTRASADRRLRELLYPVNHPQHHRVLGTPESLAALTRDDLLTFHQKWIAPGRITVAVVGGFDHLDTIARLLEQHFDMSLLTTTTLQLDLSVPRPAHEFKSELAIPGKSQADIAIGFPVLPRTAPGYQALETANLVLGRLGLMGRLGAHVRDKLGLAYYAMSGLEPGRAASLWVARAGVDPANIDDAIAAMTNEVKRMTREPVSAGELANAKSYSTGILPLALESNDGIASLLLSIEHFDLGLDYLDRYPGIVNALTVDDLHRAITDNLDPTRLAIAVARPA